MVYRTWNKHRCDLRILLKRSSSRLLPAACILLAASSAMAQLHGGLLGGGGAGGLVGPGSPVNGLTGPGSVMGIGPNVGPGTLSGATVGPNNLLNNSAANPRFSSNAVTAGNGALTAQVHPIRPESLGATASTFNGAVVVVNVQPGSIAAAANLGVNDQLLAVNGFGIRTADDLMTQLGAAAAGNGQAIILIRRDGVLYNATVNLTGKAWDFTQAPLGVMVLDGPSGVVVERVTQDSAAAVAGLKAGDEIIAIAGKPVSNSAEVIAQVQAAAHSDGQLILDIRRNELVQTVQANLHRTQQSVTADAHRMERKLGDAVHQADSRLNSTLQATQGMLANAEKSLASFTQHETGQLRQDAERTLQQLRTLTTHLKQEAGETTETFEKRLEQVRQEAAVLERELLTKASRLEVTARRDLDNAIAELKQVEEALGAIALRTVGNLEDRMHNAEARLMDIKNDLTSLAQKATNTTKQEALQAIHEVEGMAAQLKREANETVDVFRKRVFQIRQAVSSLEMKLLALSHNLESDARTDIDRAVANLRKVESELAAFADRVEDKAEDHASKLR